MSDMLCIRTNVGFETFKKSVLLDMLAPKGVADLTQTDDGTLTVHYRDGYTWTKAYADFIFMGSRPLEAWVPDREVEMEDNKKLEKVRKQETFTQTVKNCARCASTHEELVFKKLARPSDDWTHWVPCPTNGEPIMLQIVMGGGL